MTANGASPVHDDRRQFEFLILEGAQAGLSWSTVLNKRETYRKAFAGFDPVKVARFEARKIKALLQNPGIIRNRLKVAAAVANADAIGNCFKRQIGPSTKYFLSFQGGSLGIWGSRIPELEDKTVELPRENPYSAFATLFAKPAQAEGKAAANAAGGTR